MSDAYRTWYGKLARMNQILSEGRTVWFRRDSFNPEFTDQLPKWHIFADREPAPKSNITRKWVSLCGYTTYFREGLLSLPELNLSKTPPPKGERCLRCTRKHIAQEASKTPTALSARSFAALRSPSVDDNSATDSTEQDPS